MRISREEFKNIPYEQRNGIYEIEDWGTLYFVNGVRHREDGPAEEYFNGDKWWWLNNNIHRLDGPALEWFDGGKFYYIEGKKYSTREEFEKVAYMYLNGLQDYL